MNHLALALARAVLNKSFVPWYGALANLQPRATPLQPHSARGNQRGERGLMGHHLVPGTVPRCPGGSVNKGLVSCEVLGFGPLISGHCCNLPRPAPPSATCRAPWVRRAGQSRTGQGGAGGSSGQGIIIAPDTGLETELSLVYLSASQALC